MDNTYKRYLTGDDVKDLVKSVIVSGKKVTIIKYDGTTTNTMVSTEPVFTGATEEAAGAAGLIPAPGIEDRTKFLKGDGTWAEIPATEIAVDTDLSTTSENPVQNKAVAAAINSKLSLSGGTMTGALVAQSNTNYTTYQVRNMAFATSASTPTGNGSVLGVYTA